MSNDYYKNLSGRNFFTKKYVERKHNDRIEYLKYICNQNKLRAIDIGCAEGFFGKRLIDELAWQVDGVEISLDRFTALQNLNNVYSSTDEVNHKYDIILCFHVLEHIPNDNILNEFHRLLKDDGHLVIEVPNKSGHRYVENDMNVEHVRFFDQKSIVNMLSENGFTIKRYEIGCFESPSYNDTIRIDCVKTDSYYQYEKYINLFENIKDDGIIVYGTGGDYFNYIHPLINNFKIVGYYNDEHSQYNTLTTDDLINYSNLNVKVLISSIKYEEIIIDKLRKIGWNTENILTLGGILSI